MRIHPFMLDSRLSAVASFIIEGESMVDVGTDHAYLPVWLTRRGICPAALAVDINQEPLARANMTIEKYRAQELVSTKLSDGLSSVPPDFGKNIVVAGMGGDVISGILDRCGWIRDSRYNLILQPMTCHERLRKYLYQSGFDIARETIVPDNRRLYTVIQAIYRGKLIEPSIALQYAGAVDKSDANGIEYLQKQIKRLTGIADGLDKSGREHELSLQLRDAAKNIAASISDNTNT